MAISMKKNSSGSPGMLTCPIQVKLTQQCWGKIKQRSVTLQMSKIDN